MNAFFYKFLIQAQIKSNSKITRWSFICLLVDADPVSQKAKVFSNPVNIVWNSCIDSCKMNIWIFLIDLVNRELFQSDGPKF